jgi:hypothetical protein
VLLNRRLLEELRRKVSLGEIEMDFDEGKVKHWSS